LGENPRHRSLQTHEIDELTVFDAYLENITPSAGRVFWAYGPDKGDITVLGVEPHPDNKKGAYALIKLSGLPRPKQKIPSREKGA
jgi:hypothetical protein